MGMLAQGIDHTVGHRKWRLAEPQGWMPLTFRLMA